MNYYELPNTTVKNVPSPLVTIRTSTYNHEKYISQCIEGVLSQKINFPIEYIIGEDCSTDKTKEIVEKYASQYPEIIRVVTSDVNVGAKENALRCRQLARGKYMAICEGDDYWTDPYKLQKQVDLLEANPHVMICGHAVKQIDINGDVITESKFGITENLWLTPEELAFQLWNIPHLSAVYRREPNPPINKKVLNGDTLRCAWFSNHGYGYIFKDVMGVHRVHPGGIWSRLDKKSMSTRKIESWIVIPTLLKPELKSFAYLRLFLISMASLRGANALYGFVMMCRWLRPKRALRVVTILIKFLRKVFLQRIYKVRK